VALSYFDNTWIVAQSEKSASQGITLLHPRLTQDVPSGPAMIKLEHTFAAIVALKVFP
jgi:hypothetical protein